MRIITTFFLIVLFGINALAQQWQSAQITQNNTIRTYKTYHNNAAQQNMSVVIMLHGLGGSLNDIDFTNFTQIADSANVLLVSPQALDYVHPLIGNFGGTWNSGIKLTGTILGDIELNPTVDDVGFLTALINKIKVDFSVNAHKIFITGFSNGGFMTQRMLCEKPELFKAAVSHSGLKALTLTNCLSPKVPLAHFHGTTDEVVDIEGNFHMASMNFVSPVGISADSLINYWALRNNAQFVDSNIIGNVNDNNFITHYKYEGDAAVEFFKIHNGTHTWYNYAQTNNEFDLGIETWKFFIRQGANSTSVEKVVKDEAIYVYPNPANEYLNIQSNQLSHLMDKIVIIDMNGRELINQKYTKSLSIKGLSKGIYVLHVYTTNGKVLVTKFAKN